MELCLLFLLLLSFCSLQLRAQEAPAPDKYTEAGLAVPTVTSDKDDYAPGEAAIITGTGWALDSLVDIHLEEEPAHDHHHGYHDTKVNADGSWEIRYPIEERHLGTKFTVVVDGKQSGYQGLAYFTDAINTSISLTSPSSALQGSSITITATLTQINGTKSGSAVSNAEIKFYLNNILIGNSNTNSSGVASLSHVIVQPTGSYNGNSGIKAEFLGTTEYNKTSSQNPLTVTSSTCTAPAITTHPSSTPTGFTYGSDATFSTTISGIADSYQWEYRISSTSTTWIPITGATSTSYTVTKPMVSMSGYQYRIKVSGCNTNVYSNAATLTVSPKGITGSFTVPASRAYNGQTGATVSSRSLSGVLTGDVVTLDGGEANYDNKNVGTNKTVNLAGASLSGAQAGNYSLLGVNTTTADITAKQLTASIVAENKVYDGSDAATATGSVPSSDVISGDEVSVSVSDAKFNNANVGTGKAVTANVAISNTNYSLSSATASTTADITAKQLTASIVAENKVYDGNTSATLSSQSVSGMVNGEKVGLAVTAANFASSERGTHTVTATGLSLTGAGDVIRNYSLPSGATATTTATIFAVPTILNLTVSAPMPLNNTSIANVTFGPDVFSPTWVITSPSNTTATNTTTVSSSAELKITSSVVGVHSAYLTYKDGMDKVYTSGIVYLVFYDPSAGFVTGGGWINSPIDQSGERPYMAVSGRANFGFVSKYEKGANKPSGNTEFQFQAGGMNFKSSNYEWLTVAGNRAQYKGSGTINGFGDFGFMLTAVDGDLSTTKTDDLLRIKIWDKSSGKVVYDNLLNGNQDGGNDPSLLTENSGTRITGSIVIHQPVKSGTKSARETTEITEELAQPEAGEFLSYPNTFSERTTIAFVLETETAYSLEVYDLRGVLVKEVAAGTAEAGRRYEYELDGSKMASGMFVARLLTPSGIQQLRMIRR